MEIFTNQKNLTDNIDNLTKYEDIIKAYEILSVQEERVDKELEELILSQTELESKMHKLDSILPNLQVVDKDSRQLCEMIEFTSTLAENVSSKVKQLDVAKNRVVSCLQRVEDVMDLKFCTDGVQTALHDEDYEKAAAHIHRFLTLDEDILRMSAHADEGSTLDQSFKLLHESQTKLKLIIHSKFDVSVRSGDVASVERFFKTFPLIGENEAGLIKFSKYLCSQLSETTDHRVSERLEVAISHKRWSLQFADALSLLFEDVGNVVETHQPLVETYYGHGLLIGMVSQLQGEVDRQVRGVVARWRSVREVDRKLNAIKQSGFYQKSNVEKLEPKELDAILAELSLMVARAELYLSFVARRINNDFEVAFQNEDHLKEKKQETEKFLNNCQLSLTVQDLVSTYIRMEEYYMRCMICKAISIEGVDDGGMVSSMVDDSFYVVKKSVRRALSTSNVDGVCAMLNHSSGLLEKEYTEALQAKLQHGYSSSGMDSITQAYNLVQSTFVAAKLPSAASATGLSALSDSEAEKNRLGFLTALNSVEVSGGYIQTLKDNLQEDILKLYSHVVEQERAKLQSCLGDLGNISNRFKEVLNFGFAQLVTSAIKPQLRSAIESFQATNHNITEDEFNQYEASDPWVQDLIIIIDNLLSSFKITLTQGNQDQLVIHISTEVALMLEKVVVKSNFNRLGGMQLDKEVRSLVAYLVNVATWSVRDKFARLNQIATILNLESVAEIGNYWGTNSGSLTWRLTPNEVRLVLALRNDFRSDDIKRLKL